MSERKNLNQHTDGEGRRPDAVPEAHQQLSSVAPTLGSVEVDLRQFFAVLWRGKWWIVALSIIFAIAGALFSMSLPNLYTSEGVYAPVKKDGSSIAMSGQLGGLASLAGVNLGGAGNSDVDQAMVFITSWPFLEKVIDKYDLKPLLFGVQEWDEESQSIVWDEELYDPEAGVWLGEYSEREPSSFDAFVALNERIVASFDEFPSRSITL